LLIQLNQLKPNPTNVRVVKADNLDKLIASIKSRDLLHNLVVQKNGTGYNVIDGNRRYEALCEIYGKKSVQEVECKVIEDNATEVGAMANMLREGMHPLDEADAINTVVQDGTADYDTCAANWGQTRKWVMQRVALPELSAKVKEGFRNKEFNLGIAQLFTNVDTDTQDKMYDDCKGSFDYDHIKRLVSRVKLPRSQVIIPEKHKMFKEIEFTGDLFSDRQYVADMDKFLALQQQYVDDKAKYYDKKFKGCVVVDTYPSDVKGLLKNLVQVHAYEANEMDPKDLNVIMMYRPMLGDLWIQKFKSKIEMSKKELDAIESGEIPELTLADMSNPQRELTNEMYYNYLRSEFVKSDQSDLWVLAMLCNNIVSIGNKNDVTYSMTYFSTKEGVNYDYFDNLRKEVAEYCKTNKCNTIQYYLSKDHVDLTNILYQGIVASMDQSHAFQSQKDLYNILPSKNWFQPSEEWLNKYKITQLRLLANKVKCALLPTDNKKMVIDKLIVAFNDGAVFDPIKFLDTVK
jgi:ParB/RepB/Spo0J family partition protein